MRPEVLFPLFKPVGALKGIGPRLAKLVETLAGPRVVNLLWHLPSGIIDRRYAPKIGEAEPGRIATITVRVDRHRKPPNRRIPYKVQCSDETGTLTLVFFHAHADYLAGALPTGEMRVVSGRVDDYDGDIQMTHPDHIAEVAELARLQTVEPVYPLTEGLSLKVLSRAVRAAVALAPPLEEWIDPTFVARQGWKPWRDALTEAHAPATTEALDPATPARCRLAYDELLANQVALCLVRASFRRLSGRRLQGDGALRAKVLAALPFQLTPAQQTAVSEIVADMESDSRMLRLLQGDVGSGKTVVALLAMLNAVESGTQAALMAPTDVLARQHMATLEPLAAAAGVPIVLLTGREKGKAREIALARIAEGEAPLVVGTHALFQEDVAFRDLGLAVIDEQHRFGVHQRLMLAAKGRAADVLVMTSTPIPRTLMLTAYGDMDVSRLTGKPPGRRPVDTRLVPTERTDEVIEAVGRSVKQGAGVYWVCPLIEESEALDVAAAEDRHRALAQAFPGTVGLLHGRMKEAERDRTMAAFEAGDIRILVATTVIEVGVDVAHATVMVVEHAERFGLAQLHQLRGRVGRGEKPSTCLLLYAKPLTPSAESRLRIMRETEDGFRIAEEDLRLRGAGEVLGTRQSGVPEFRLADLSAHGELLGAARDDALLVLQKDPELRQPRGQAVRTLLYLFERDAVARNLRSG